MTTVEAQVTHLVKIKAPVIEYILIHLSHRLLHQQITYNNLQFLVPYDHS